MDKINSKVELEALIKEKSMVLIYFSGKDCGVCTVLQPKVEKIMMKYSEIKSVIVKVEENIDIAAAYSIFTIPAILLFIEGKEVIREARYISMQKLEEKIDRYYEMFLI